MGTPVRGHQEADNVAKRLVRGIRVFVNSKTCMNLDRKTLRTAARDLFNALGMIQFWLDVRAQQSPLVSSAALGKVATDAEDLARLADDMTSSAAESDEAASVDEDPEDGSEPDDDDVDASNEE